MALDGLQRRLNFQISGKCIGFTRTGPGIATYGMLRLIFQKR